MPIPAFLFSLLIVLIAFANPVFASTSTPENSDQATCEQNLMSVTLPAPNNIRLFVLKDPLWLNGRRYESGRYQMKFEGGRVTDLDGFVSKGQSFPSFLEMMATLDPALGDIHHNFYRATFFRYRESSMRRMATEFLVVEDYKRQNNWDNLPFLPTDETALYSQTKQTKAVFKRLKSLKARYSLELVPDELARASVTRLLEYYQAVAMEARRDLLDLRIKNVETPAEKMVNDVIKATRHHIRVAIEKNSAAFLLQFGGETDSSHIIDFNQLSLEEYGALVTLRSIVRSKLSELQVALRVPKLLGTSLTLQQAFERGLFPRNDRAITELVANGVFKREFDVITSDAIYEVKSAFPPEFVPSKLSNQTQGADSENDAPEETYQPNLEAELEPETETTAEVAPLSDQIRIQIPKENENASSREPPIRNQTSPTLSLMREHATLNKNRITRQVHARALAIRILKKHGLVPQSYGSFMVNTDGILRTLTTPEPSVLGVIKL